MASSAVMTAVQSRLAANWTQTPIILPNDGGKVPADGTAFLTIEYPVANEQMKSIGAPGANVWREEGSFRIVLCVQIGTGINPTATPYADWVDALRTVFRGQAFSGVTCFEATPPFLNDESDRGAYFEFSFAVAYWFDIVG